MTRPSHQKNLLSALASVATVSLAACGGSHSSTLPQPAPVSSAAPAPYLGPLADATFKITIPVPTTSAKARRPAYVSSSTTKIVFTLNSDTVGLTGAALTTFNSTILGAKAVTLGSATCPGTGPWTCTLAIKLPPGTDTVTMSAQDGSSNILSQQVQNFAVVAATANSFTVTLDANANVMTVTGSQLCHSSSAVGSSYGSVGTSSVDFTVGYTDLAGKSIVGPGLPILAVNGFSDAATHSISATGGTVSVVVNQAQQKFTLTPSNANVSNANIAVTGTPASGSDGLSFTTTTNFAFSTGPAPTRPFLTVVEQLGTNSGQISLFTLPGFTDTSTADTISPYTTSLGATTLAVQNNDIDNPTGLAFDAQGDLLIANAGTNSTTDPGSFACVPAGAIATGANAATVLTTNVDDAISIAEGTDNSVALADLRAGANYNLVQFVLNGSYQAASTTRDIANPGHTVGSFRVIAMPSLAAGTYAAAISNGTSTYRVALKEANGTETDISDSTIVDPQDIAWDAHNAQLVIPSGRFTKTGTPGFCPPAGPATCFADIDFYSVGTSSPPVPAQVKVIPSTYNNVYAIVYHVAVSPLGIVAVAITPSSGKNGPPVIQIYDGSAARNKISAIPYNTLTTSCLASSGGSGCPYINGDTCPGGPCQYEYSANNNGIAVDDLRFLSDHKLLVALQSDGNPTEGLYIYDVSKTEQPPGYDDGTGLAPGLAPKKTGFLQTTLRPFGTAFLP